MCSANIKKIKSAYRYKQIIDKLAQKDKCPEEVYIQTGYSVIGKQYCF